MTEKEDDPDNFDVTFTSIKGSDEADENSSEKLTVESQDVGDFKIDESDDLSQVDIPGEAMSEDTGLFDDLGDLEETKTDLKAFNDDHSLTSIAPIDEDALDDLGDELGGGLGDDLAEHPSDASPETIRETHAEENVDLTSPDFSVSDEHTGVAVDEKVPVETHHVSEPEQLTSVDLSENTSTEQQIPSPNDQVSAPETNAQPEPEPPTTTDSADEELDFQPSSEVEAFEDTDTQSESENSDLSLGSIRTSEAVKLETSHTLMGNENLNSAETEAHSDTDNSELDAMDDEDHSLVSMNETIHDSTNPEIRTGTLIQSLDEIQGNDDENDETNVTEADKTTLLESKFEDSELMKHHVSETENAPQSVRGKNPLMGSAIGAVSKLAIPQIDPLQNVRETTQHIENFEDIRDFGTKLSPTGKLKTPVAFSILITNIKYIEDADFIIRTLKSKSLNIDLTSIEKQLKRGKVLIPRISEYAAMYFARTLRKIEANLIVGPSDEIFTSASYEENESQQLVSKQALNQNRAEGINFSEIPETQLDVILTTSSTVPGETISQFKGVVTSSKAIPLDMLPDVAMEIFSDEVLSNIRRKSLNKEANAVVGVQILIQPFHEQGEAGETSSRYQIVATGTAVKLAVGEA